MCVLGMVAVSAVLPCRVWIAAFLFSSGREVDLLLAPVPLKCCCPSVLPQTPPAPPWPFSLGQEQEGRCAHALPGLAQAPSATACGN